VKRSPTDALRNVPPREFVGARKALAARLAREGKTAAAREVSRLRRPSPVVWALNRAATTHPRELAALAESVDRLRRAQLGRGDLRAATAEYRAAFDPLMRAATAALREAGSGVSGAIERRIRSTLQAAVTDRGRRADLGAGRLSDELTDPGFAVLTGAPVPAEFLRARPARPRSASARSEARGEGHSPAAPRPADTRRLARQHARAARSAARQARALERKAQQAARAATRAEQRVEAMRRTLRALEQRSAALRAAADEARKAHEEHGKLPAAERS
jgi:hypothetical protein